MVRKFHYLVMLYFFTFLSLTACTEVEKIEQDNVLLTNGIPFVLEDSVSKHYPGIFIAAVTRDYFSPEYQVKFDKETRIICEYDQSKQLNRFGFVASCHRALLPDGREINLMMITHALYKNSSESFSRIVNKNNSHNYKMEFIFSLEKRLTDKNILRKKVYERSGYSIPIFIEREEKILFVPAGAIGVMHPTGKLETK